MTNFAYNPNIPAAVNNPSADQPNMLTNTNSISGIIAVDHIGFELPNGGFHNTIHMSSQSPAAPPVGFGELFTLNTSDGIATSNILFYNNANSNLTQLTRNFTPTNAPSGATFLPGGLILNWAQSAVNFSGTATTITFPRAYVTAVYSITIGCINNSGVSPTSNNVYISATTLTNFTVVNSSSTQVTAIYWMALGN